MKDYTVDKQFDEKTFVRSVIIKQYCIYEHFGCQMLGNDSLVVILRIKTGTFTEKLVLH